jgi:membrane protein
MFDTFRIPLSWTDLLKQTVKEASEDNVLGLAAQLAYYFALALVPAIVFIIAIASFFPPHLIQDSLASMSGVLPADVFSLLQGQVQSLAGAQNGGLLTFGFLMALWSSSAAMVSITDAMNRVYDIEEGRPWWRVRLTALGLTIALALFILIALFLVMVGPTVAEWIASRMGLGAAFEVTWKILQWPVVLALIAFGIGLIYYFAPDAEQDWEWITPGALTATVLWLVASLGFKIYVANFADYNATYGSLGGLIVLLLWFYLTGLAILAGAEMNAEIEHVSPHGKDAGEKVPGERKKLGAAAARAYEQNRQRPAADGPPSPSRARPFSPQPVEGRRKYLPGALLYLVVRFFKRERT